MPSDIQTYHDKQTPEYKEICELLYTEINNGLPTATSKVWHGHPVWFLDGNPIVGYSVRKDSLQLMFWSGQSFDEPELEVLGSTRFKAAQKRYTSVDQINTADLQRWLEKATTIQWDYKNIVKRKGVLERLK